MRCFSVSSTVLFLLFAQAVAGQPAAGNPAGAFALPISDVSNAYVKSSVTLQGTITSYTPPRTDKAPHSFMLKDSSGSIRIAAWKDAWDAIPFRDRIQPGADVTVRVEISEFQRKLEGHLNSAADIQLGSVKQAAPSPGPAASGVSASPAPGAGSAEISWQPDIASALRVASSQKKKVLVFFANPDAENSNYVETRVLADARVRAAISGRFVAARVDIKQQPDLARQLGVFRAGTIGIYMSEGSPASPHVAPRAPEDLLKALE
jgi:uncharacterized protein YdeI (BOF family)